MREKLIDLLGDTVAECMPTECLADIADHLIANGVTIPVRCKDCEYYGYEPYDNGDKACVKWGEWIFPHDDDFCSCGERKDND